MPAYKTEKYIGQTIESVIAQTYPNWELLITDDCSPDNLKKVILSYADKDPRIKYFLAPQNGGPANARNNSLKHAQGQFIAFLDSDDIWLPKKLEKQIRFMQKNNFAFCYTAYQRIKENGTPYCFINYVPPEISYRDLLKNTSIATLTVILDRSKVGKIQMTHGWGYDDYILWLEILKSGINAHGLNECLARYRVMESSVSSNKKRALKWVWNIYYRQQKLGLIKSVYHLANFVFNASLRRVK